MKSDVVATLKSDIVSTLKSDVVSMLKYDVVSTIKYDVVSTLKSNVVSTLKYDVISTLKFDVVSTFKSNVVSTLKSDVETILKMGSFPNAEITHVVSTLQIGCSSSLNLKTTLKQRCVSAGYTLNKINKKLRRRLFGSFLPFRFRSLKYLWVDLLWFTESHSFT